MYVCLVYELFIYFFNLFTPLNVLNLTFVVLLKCCCKVGGVCVWGGGGGRAG